MKSVLEMGILFYRKYLSPIKGFKCAYGTFMHENTSKDTYHRLGCTCSGYGLKVAKRFNTLVALKLLFSKQFPRCQAAKQLLDLNFDNRKAIASARLSQAGFADCACDASGCDAPSCDMPSCDMPSCECPTHSIDGCAPHSDTISDALCCAADEGSDFCNWPSSNASKRKEEVAKQKERLDGLRLRKEE